MKYAAAGSPVADVTLASSKHFRKINSVEGADRSRCEKCGAALRITAERSGLVFYRCESSTVSLAGSTLQRAGFIRYRRGKIAVLDWGGLEKVSCECYAYVKQQFDEAFGDGRPAARKNGQRRCDHV